MSYTELKKQLIDRIAEIDDVEFLNAIKTILEYKKKEKYIYLSEENEAELLKASEAGKSGHYISQSELDQKVEEWLKEE